MPDDITPLLLRLIGGNPDATAEVLELAPLSRSPSLLVAAALVAQDPEYLAQAARYASTTRDRQLVALADADLHGRADLLDALVRDHLADHPDHLLAAWIAGRHLPRHH